MQSALALPSAPKLYTGVETYATDEAQFQKLYREKTLELERFYSFNENAYVVVTAGTSQSALCRYSYGRLRMLDLKYLDTATEIKPRNKEQYFAMDSLIDDTIKVTCLTGKAGSGKTLLALAAATRKVKQGVYKKIILTKPSSQVGKRDLGILPGNLEEKFMPFLINYSCNMEVIFGEQKKLNVDMLFHTYNIEIVPMQLLRGASFNNALILADEVQVLDHHEMLTLGTRISENSKLVIMGDLDQRDEKIAKEATGLFRFVNSGLVKDAGFTSSVHLQKCERGEVSALFSAVFEAG